VVSVTDLYGRILASLDRNIETSLIFTGIFRFVHASEVVEQP
jgi:hypothetical protein